ncbi:hypothetical protein [Streptomyces sp. NPDC001914]|uniref:hypothetical protein n=1 Tax=Streptomyces sp. NPDC001914 TaxID=3364623 RepID=UPI0036C5291C
MRCTLCNTSTIQYGTLCPTCTLTTRNHIADLPRMWEELEDWLTPGSRGASPYSGRPSKVEAPMPLDEDVLSLRAAGGIIGVLEDWHSAVRHARTLPELPAAAAASPARRVHAAAHGLASHIHFIALWEQGPVLGSEIRRLVDRVQNILEPGRNDDAPRFLGHCIAVDESGVVCGAKLYADMSRPVQCDWCLCPYPPSQWLQLRHFQPGRTPTHGDASSPAGRTEERIAA